MREIKFRGICKNSIKWVYGYFVNYARVNRDGFFETIITLDNDRCESKPHLVLKETVGQFTGLHDKNGKEIYEGDIVCLTDRPKPVPVVFKEGCFYTPDVGGNYRLGGWDKNRIEVIGNIYENPELLEG